MIKIVLLRSAHFQVKYSPAKINNKIAFLISVKVINNL